jgi:hypothetical protein
MKQRHAPIELPEAIVRANCGNGTVTATPTEAEGVIGDRAPTAAVRVLPPDLGLGSEGSQRPAGD